MAIYELTSFFNHSCLPSAHRTEYGDAMVIRASRAIKAGEEVTLDYFTEAEGEDSSTMSQQAWGFTCKPAICVAKQLDGPATLAKRDSLLKSLKAEDPQELEAARILSSLEKTYEKPRWERFLSSGV